MSSPSTCNCEESMRSACHGPPSYEGVGGKRYCVLHFPNKDKSADFDDALRRKLEEGKFDFSGVWFPGDFSRKVDFTATVIFSKATFNAPVTFREINFTEALFDSATFKAPVTFRDATFNGKAYFNSTIFQREVNFRTTFKAKADFSQAKFRNLAGFTKVIFEKNAEPNFWDAKFFARANFEQAEFHGLTNFDAVTFKEEARFDYATFGETVHFRDAIFQDRVFFDLTTFTTDANFRGASFKDSVSFKGTQTFSPISGPDLRGVKFDRPELVSFHSLTLRPYWFLDVNASKFALADVDWHWPVTIDREISGIPKDVASPYTLLRIACWNLAVNAEENHRYDEASKFRYLAMEARRQADWRAAKRVLARWMCSLRRSRKEPKRILTKSKRFWKSLRRSFGWLHWLYWLVSGYGERILRASMVLAGILIVFAGIYAATLCDKAAMPLRWRALPYSAAVMMLQRPEPLPVTAAQQGLVLLETILGPVQAALLLLAIRRKFMR